MRELSFALNDKIEKYTHFPQKVYKLSKATFSRFDRTRGDKNQIFRTLKATKLNKKSIQFIYCEKNKIKFGGKSNAAFFKIYNNKNPISVLTRAYVDQFWGQVLAAVNNNALFVNY